MNSSPPPQPTHIKCVVRDAAKCIPLSINANEIWWEYWIWGGQADKPPQLLPEGLKEISQHGCVKPNRQHVVLKARCSQVSLAVGRWPPAPACAARTHLHACACIIMDLQAMREKYLTLGKPSAGADLRSLDYHAGGAEKGSRKMTSDEKYKRRGDKLLQGSLTLHCKSVSRWSKQEEGDGRGRASEAPHFWREY